ncbi:44563_t:CDS:1, partial [Gigaspora margarita]
WLINTSSSTHMADILFLSENPELEEALKIENEFKPILILLVDGGPDENPKYLKNIKEYCNLFKKLNLDYLSVRTHAPGQSAFNPVERSMSTLSGKLAGIVLPIDNFGSHLDSVGNIMDNNLAIRNFQYAGERLCELWQRDKIHGKNVIVKYIANETDLFNETSNISWIWIEKHCQLCRYSLDIRKCNNTSCCSMWRAEEAAALLSVNNGFLPPATKDRDGHFLNSIHILQYMDKKKLPGYDKNCPSISPEYYSRLSCSTCQRYFPTLAFLAQHKKSSHPSTSHQGRKPKIRAATDDCLSYSTTSHMDTTLYISSLSDNEFE